MKKVDNKMLKEVVNGLIEMADKERKESQPYKDLFSSSETAESLLRSCEMQMTEIVLNACEVLKEKFGLEKIGNEKYALLQALPFIADTLEKEITKQDGMSCCVDKTYYILSKKILE